MSGLRLLLVAAWLPVVAGCDDLGEPLTDDMVDDSGTIVQNGPQSFLIQSDHVHFGSGLRIFAPSNLPDAYRRDGLRIRFTGTVDSDPPLCCAYPPLRLLRIGLDCERCAH